ncbi:MAG: glycosyltransferase [Pseudonocardiaceae bacterium]|nr:glycosyltransferase [Pseudonocardiaceae bacterium]
MPLLSVITAGYAPKSDYLKDTVISVLEQDVPPGWEFEWLFQEDGTTPCLGDLVQQVPQARYEANDRSFGIAATRNLALSRGRGDLLRVLDHDDVLLPGALSKAITHFVEHQGIHWLLTASDEIDFAGKRYSCPPPPMSGWLPRGSMGPITDSNGRWSVYSAGLTARLDTVRALGGWMAAPRSEDVGLVTALAEVADGYIDPCAGWLYRRHPVQTHLDDDWQARESQAATLVTQRLAAMRSAGVMLRNTASLSFKTFSDNEAR